MNVCAWCLKFSNGRAQWCPFPYDFQCETEKRLEDMAYAINMAIKEPTYDARADNRGSS